MTNVMISLFQYATSHSSVAMFQQYPAPAHVVYIFTNHALF